MADILSRRTLTLTALVPAFVAGPFALDPTTSDIRVRLRRPTPASALAWDDASTVRVSIIEYVDGSEYVATSQFTGGIRLRPDGRPYDEASFSLQPQKSAITTGTRTPVRGADGKDRLQLTRRGETARTSYTAGLRIELIRGTEATLDLIGMEATTATAPTITWHHSVAYDSDQSTQEQGGDGILSVTIDPVGTTDLGAFAYSGNGVASPQAGATTYAGVAMTEMWDEAFQTDYRHAGYQAVGIPSDSQTVTNTLAGSPGAHVFGVIVMTGVHQTVPVGTPATANGTTAAPTVTVTDQVAGDMVVAGVTSIDNDFEAALGAVGADQTEQWRVNTATDSLFGAGSTQLGAAGGVMSWADSTATQWGIGAVAFKTAVPFVETITFVTSGGATIGTAASTWSLAVPSSKVGGGAFIVGVGPASSVVTVSTVTDNTTNVYLKAIAAVGSTRPAAGAELWYCNLVSSASTRISVTLSGNASGSMGVAHFTGLSTASPHDSTGSTSNRITTNSTVHTAGQVTPGASNALVIMFSRSVNSTISPSTFDGGMTAWISTGTAVRTHGSYILQGADASTCSGQWRTNAANSTGLTQHVAVIASFLDTRAVAGGGDVVLYWCPMALMGAG